MFLVAFTPRPAPQASLAGRTAMRRKSEGRWSEDPKSGKRDTHLSHQLILPPLSTGPDQAPDENTSILDSCYSSDLLLEFRSPLTAAAPDDTANYTHAPA